MMTIRHSFLPCVSKEEGGRVVGSYSQDRFVLQKVSRSFFSKCGIYTQWNFMQP
jgi:hypothetical protein